jgi:parvulin-like peptidyl-prolyl isomerase
VLATVNGVPITAADVEKYIWDWKMDEVVENLVNFETVNIEAKRLHITATPAEIQAKTDADITQFKASLRPGEDWIASLRSKGFPPSRLALIEKSTVLLDKIALRDFHPADYVKVSTIIAKPKASPAGTPVEPVDPAADLKTVQSYYDLLTKGTPWSTVLASSTTDQTIIKNNGLIGWRAVSAFPKEAAAELLKLKPGGITHPYSTAYGVQLFRLEESGTGAPESDLKELKDAFIRSHRDEIVKSLKATAKVVTIH